MWRTIVFILVLLIISTIVLTTRVTSPRHVDIERVAWTIYLEARGEPLAGMTAVASVIYNRAEGNVCRFNYVVTQPYQFAGWDKNFNFAVPEDADAFSQAFSISYLMHHGEFTPTGTWNHFYNYKISPWWANGYKKTRIGNHVFITIDKKDKR